MNELSTEYGSIGAICSLSPRDFYEAIFDLPGVAVYVLRVEADGSCCFEDANALVGQVAGRPVEEIFGRAPRDCLPAEIGDCVDSNCQLAIETRETVTYERTIEVGDARMSFVTALVPIVIPGSRITHVVGVTRDITHEKRALDDAEEDQALLRGLEATLPQVVFLLNVRNGAIRFIGGQLTGERARYRKKVEGMGGRQLYEHTHPEDIPKLVRHFDELAALRDDEVSTIDFRAEQHDGSYRHLRSRETVFRRTTDGSVELVLGLAEDITDRDHWQQQMDELSDRLANSQSEERRKIAQELHDSTAQHLVAASLSLMRIWPTPSEKEAQPARLVEALAEVKRSLGEAQREIRVLSYLLHPPEVEREGLSEAIRSFAAGFASRTGVAVETRIDQKSDELEPALAVSLFRVAQEALANVHRHAHAGKVSIMLDLNEAGVTLAILDDGVGFDEAAIENAVLLGVGISGMRERMARFGGSLRIVAAAGGTSLVAFAPRQVAGS